MMPDSKYRGLSDQQISAIKRDEKMMELLRDPKLFLGIRNGYFNLYFQGASTGKCSILDTGGLNIWELAATAIRQFPRVTFQADLTKSSRLSRTTRNPEKAGRRRKSNRHC